MNTLANALSGHNVPRLNECETDAGDGTAMSAGERLPGTPVPMHVWKGAGGVGIAADRWGDPAGRLVLLLHGGGRSAERRVGAEVGSTSRSRWSPSHSKTTKTQEDKA